MVAEQLTTHLENEALLHPMQFGFRTNHSTETACCHLMESIKSSLDTGKVVGAVFLDLCRAFNTVNHAVLQSKLNQYKLSLDTLSWIKSYLAGCSQCYVSMPFLFVCQVVMSGGEVVDWQIDPVVLL